MKKRVSTQSSSLLVMLSLFTILIQFAAYYFFNYNIAIWGIACVVSIICCHILLCQTITYHICFDYSFLTMFMSLIIIILTYFGNNQDFSYSGTMLGIAFINWLIPMLHCFFRYMLDYGTTVDDFNSFYRDSSIVFFIFYIGILIYGSFTPDVFGWAYKAIPDNAVFVPFKIITLQVKHYLDGSVPFINIIIYLASRILIYLPYGFIIMLVLRRKSRLSKGLSVFILPFLIETVQYFTIPVRCDIDDLIYAVISSLLGFLAFMLINAIYRAFSGRNFLMNEETYRRYGNTLHF